MPEQDDAWARFFAGSKYEEKFWARRGGRPVQRERTMTTFDRAAAQAREALWREHGTQFGPETMALLVRSVLQAIRVDMQLMQDVAHETAVLPGVVDLCWTRCIDRILKDAP